jgi:hypothetical protein
VAAPSAFGPEEALCSRRSASCRASLYRGVCIFRTMRGCVKNKTRHAFSAIPISSVPIHRRCATGVPRWWTGLSEHEL